MKKKKHSIQSLLSFYFILFSFILLAVTAALFSWNQYHLERQAALETLRQISISVADSVDQQINQMSQVTLTAIRSTDMQDVFVSYIAGNDSAYERNQKRTLLANLLTNARGLDFSIRQLNLYAPTADGNIFRGYGVGEYNGALAASAQELPWYEKTKEAAGRLVIAGPLSAKEAAAGYASGSGRSHSDRTYLSVCRMFYNIQHVPVGFVEVRKFYDDVFSLAISPELSYQASIYVYDQDGGQLFPALNAEQQETSYFPYAQSGEETLENEATGMKEYVSFAQTDDLVVAAVAQQSAFVTRIWQSMFWILIVFLIAFALAFPVAWFFSRRISSPIRNIYHFLLDQNKDRFDLLEMEDTGIREIDRLTESINESIRNTQASTDALMTLKEQELQAQMLALQSQMNPHFLYNSLSTIGEMAEEGLTEPVAEMCHMITDIMRYISSNREQRSTLEEELEICDMYLDCIRMRFGDQLTAIISVPDEMLEILIPKLCIQLLVENATRSVTTASPPWEIRVECSMDEENWKVTVHDNGPGFDPEVDRRLRSQMDYILENGILPSLKIQGMGILNIFIRIYLLEGIPFMFDMGNHPEGGAFVTIGGRIHRASEDTKTITDRKAVMDTNTAKDTNAAKDTSAARDTSAVKDMNAARRKGDDHETH